MMELIMNKIKFQTYKIDFADIEIKEGRNRVSIFDIIVIVKVLKLNGYCNEIKIEFKNAKSDAKF